MHVITESLLVGNINDAREPAATVSALLLVAEEYVVIPPQWITFAKIPMEEYAPADAMKLSHAVDWLEEHLPSNRVMVCCRAGMGRSASVVMAYLCCAQGMTYGEAVKFVMARRPGAMPLPNLQESIQEVLCFRQVRTPLSKDTANQSQAAPKRA